MRGILLLIVGMILFTASCCDGESTTQNSEPKFELGEFVNIKLTDKKGMVVKVLNQYSPTEYFVKHTTSLGVTTTRVKEFELDHWESLESPLKDEESEYKSDFDW